VITNNSAYSTYDLQNRVQQGTLANAGPSRAVIRVGQGGGTGVPKSSNVLCRQVSAFVLVYAGPQSHLYLLAQSLNMGIAISLIPLVSCASCRKTYTAESAKKLQGPLAEPRSNLYGAVGAWCLGIPHAICQAHHRSTAGPMF